MDDCHQINYFLAVLQDVWGTREMDASQMLFSMSVKNLTELQAVKRRFTPPLSLEIRRKAACVSVPRAAVRP